MALVGESLGHFQVLEELGAGGMGAVYRARDTRLERDVALKVIHGEVASRPDYRERFLREARAAAAVSHPNIATVYEVGEAEGRLFIAMELVDGRSLAGVLDLGPLPQERALRVARGIAGALASAHAAGLVHRDLKPDNVMLLAGDTVKVLDFGIAKWLAPAEAPGSPPSVGSDPATADTALTREGDVIGTPGYMSPEQALGLAVDRRSDVFSFGAMLYELLTGRRPFKGRSAMEAAVSAVHDEPAPIAELVEGIDERVAALVHRCLAKDPADRFDDASALLEALSLDVAPRAAVAGPKGSRRRATLVAPALALTAAAAVVIAMRRSPEATIPTATSATAGAGSAAARPTATPITAIPAPRTSSPEALASYRRALQAFRDGDWFAAQAALEKAVEHDESLAAAHLRLSLVHAFAHSVQRALGAFRRATALRDELGNRDRAMYHALEPFVFRSPADLPEMRRRFEEACRRYPMDAELHMLLAVSNDYLGDRSRAITHARRAATIDPRYADAWQTLGQALLANQRVDEARQAYDRCVASSPAALDCLFTRMELDSVLGSCEAVVKDARTATVLSPRAGYSHGWLAIGLYATGAGLDGVAEAQRQARKHYPEKDRARREGEAVARLASLRGDFVAAEKAALALVEAAGDDARQRGLAVRLLVAIRFERGDRAGADAAARDFLGRAAAWAGAPVHDVMHDATPFLWRARLDAKTASIEDLAPERERWRERWPPKTTGGADAWLLGQALLASTPKEATAALDTRPRGLTPAHYVHGELPGLWWGRLLWLAGRDADAAAALRLATRTCTALLHPLSHTHAFELLGRVEERRGDKDAACAAYATVLARWGEAKPRSVTAERAARRSRALGCKR